MKCPHDHTDEKKCPVCGPDALARHFKKNDAGKPPLSRIPREALEEVAQVLAFGAKKYDWDNWMKCDDLRRYYDAALRHIYAAANGEKLDSESGLTHNAHALCCLIFALVIEKGKK